MKWIVLTTAIAATFSAKAALSQTTKPDVSSAPSAQNSGAGIAGAPGLDRAAVAERAASGR
jgi:hypothetical protein